MNISRDDLERMIDQYVLSELYRSIVKRKLIDSIPYEALAEEYDMSVRQCKRIVYRAKEILFESGIPTNLFS